MLEKAIQNLKTAARGLKLSRTPEELKEALSELKGRKPSAIPVDITPSSTRHPDDPADLLEKLRKNRIRRRTAPLREDEEGNPNKKNEAIASEELSVINFLEADETTINKYLDLIARDENAKKYLQILKHEKTKGELLNNLMNAFNTFSESFQEEILKQPLSLDLIKGFFNELQKSPNWRLLQDLVAQPETPMDILKAAANPNSKLNPNNFVRATAIANPNLTDSDWIAENYSKEKDEIVKNAYLDNPNTPPEVIAEIYSTGSNPEDYNTKLKASINPNTNYVQLKHIFITAVDELFNIEPASPKKGFDNSYINKLKVELNKPTAASIRRDSRPLGLVTNVLKHAKFRPANNYLFEALSESSNDNVLLALLENPQVPQGVVEDLAEHDNYAVSQTAKDRLGKS